MNSIDKFINRQKNKPRIYGVHQAMLPAYPGASTPGWYVRNKGNLETAKYIHREELKCILILKDRIKLV